MLRFASASRFLFASTTMGETNMEQRPWRVRLAPLPLSGMEQTTRDNLGHLGAWRTAPNRVVNVDRLNGDVIVTFENGKNAVYPAPVQYELLPQVSGELDSDTAETS
jgi:hypothetical protein